MNTGFLALYSHILSYLVRKTGQSTPGPLSKSNHRNPFIFATVDAFRGHGFSLLVTAFLRDLQLMLFQQWHAKFIYFSKKLRTEKARTKFFNYVLLEFKKSKTYFKRLIYFFHQNIIKLRYFIRQPRFINSAQLF